VGSWREAPNSAPFRGAKWGERNEELMTQIGLIAWREIRGYFTSWLAYALLAGWLLLAGLGFLLTLLQYAQSQNFSLQGLFGFLVILMLFITPLLTMRLIVEERNQGTLEMLHTSPLTEWQVALGKFFGAWGFVAVMLLLSGHLPFFSLRYGSIDTGPVWGGYIALACVGAAFVAFGLFCSSVSTSQVVAGFWTFGGLLFFWLLASVGQRPGASDLEVFIGQLSVLTHVDRMLQGAVDTKDLIYFASVTIFFLFTTVRSLESRKWN
jgi:ABC-2 type transport system permease protein